MESFVFKNSLNKSLTIDYSGDYMIDSYEGLSASEIIPSYSAGFMQNGSTFKLSNLGTRIIFITFKVIASSALEMYEKRRNLIEVFNPLLGEGVLTYTNDFISKSITATVTAQPQPAGKESTIQYYTLELTAFNPLWYDNAETAIKLGDFTGGLELPLIFDDTEDGLIFAQKGAIATATIVGDVPSPVRVEFKNNSVNPKLELVTTGEYLEVNTTIIDEESLIINTAYGNKTVTKINTDDSTESAFHLISLTSTFFQLGIGNNSLSFSSDAGTPEVYIYFRNYFVGV